MEPTGLLSAWWMPREEEALWETMYLSAPHKIMFLTGLFSFLNSMSHSLVRIFPKRTQLSPKDQVWLSHRIVELCHASFSFIYSLCLFLGWAVGDNSFWKDRVFAASAYQELLANAHSAYSIYSIGVSLFNFRAFGKDRVWLNVARGGVTLGTNYLYLMFPCILGARLRIYWDLLEVATSVAILAHLVQYLKVQPKTVGWFSMAALILCLVRFWLTMFLLMWAYQWISSENVWSGIPREIPVSEAANAYLTGTGIGAIVMSSLAFIDFRHVTQSTKEFTDQFRKRTPQPHS